MPHTPLNGAHAPPNAADAKYSDAYAPSLDVETAMAVLHLKEKWQAEIRSRLREVEAERDALAAHVEEGQRLARELLVYDVTDDATPLTEWCELETPATSLARLKADAAAKALEVLADDLSLNAGNARENGYWKTADVMEDASSEALEASDRLRRQAKGGER